MRIERFDCPVQFLRLLLKRLKSAFLNKIDERSHWRPPVWRKKTRQFSWKCFVQEEVEAVFNDSSTPLTTKKSFRGDQEIDDCNPVRLTGMSAIAQAKANASGLTGQRNQQPTCRASLVVGYGEGRATREFEVIWWPDIYSNQQRGKLALRLYVAKVILTN